MRRFPTYLPDSTFPPTSSTKTKKGSENFSEPLALFFALNLQPGELRRLVYRRCYWPVPASASAPGKWPDRILDLAQGKFERLVRGMNEVDLQPSQQFRRQVLLHVRLVLCRQQDFADPGTLCAQDFLLDPAHRKYDSRERNFSSHRYERTNRAATQQADQRSHHRHSRRRAIFRDSPRWNVDVDVLLAEEVRIDAVAVGVGANPGERRAHGFLHHLAEVPGHGELFSSAHVAGFDEHDIAARGSPDQSDRRSRTLHSLFHFFLDVHPREAQNFPDHFCGYHQRVGFSFRQTPGLFADQRGDLAFQAPHSRFPRVTVNYFVQRFVGEFQVLAQLDSMLRSLARNQIPLGDVNFLFLGVAG